ncbi:MAG: sigma-70 family RNA polymerase sigma factor [Patescibacteria group bacterium]|jgi:RNA polymerase sigma-70 factor (ECF subfamily)
MKELTDNQLITAYREGDGSAFENLVNRHLKSVYFYCVRLVGKDEANDMTQEVFIKVWKHLNKYDVEKNFKVWLFRIARNTCLDYLRKKQPMVFSDLKKEDEMSVEENIPDQRKGVEEKLFAADQKSELDTALAKLSIPTQEVFELFYRDELTFNEIAETLKLSVNTIKSRHRRGIVELQKILKGQ